MNISTLEQARKDMEHGVYNMTENGKCTGCGNCCSNILPMTDKEIEVIRLYIKKHHIKECKHTIPLANPFLDMTCPFLNTDKKTEKCTIYSVRPAICRFFICSEPNGALKHKELWRGVRNPVNVRETFYGKGLKGMKVFVRNRTDDYSWCDNYKAVVVSEDELHAERYARWKIDDFRKAKLKVTEIDLEAGEQILSVENVGA